MAESVAQQIANGTLRMIQDVFAHDYAEKAAIMRASTAAGYGLDPSAYVRPFPGSTNNVTIHPPATNGGLTKLAIAAALLGGGGLGGAAISGALKPGVPPTVAPTAIAPTTPAEREYELRWELRDGKLQQTIEEVKPNE